MTWEVVSDMCLLAWSLDFSRVSSVLHWIEVEMLPEEPWWKGLPFMMVLVFFSFIYGKIDRKSNQTPVS